MIVAITGARGLLGGELIRVIGARQATVGWSSGFHEGYRQVDVRSADDIARALDDDQPDIVVHCAADPNIASCESDPDAARELNALAVRKLATATLQRNIRLVQMSTDYVFAGDKDDGYTEDDEVEPLQVYGRTKAEAEQYCLAAGNCLVIRVPLLYGVGHVRPKVTFPQEVARNLAAGTRTAADNVEIRQPAWTSDVANVVHGLVEAGITGVIHVAPGETTTKYDWAVGIANLLDLDPALLDATAPQPGGNRPLQSVLRTERLASLKLLPPHGYRESTPAFLKAVGIT
jgi:dTDP-4-dehydrorhamnose reductase